MSAASDSTVPGKWISSLNVTDSIEKTAVSPDVKSELTPISQRNTSSTNSITTVSVQTGQRFSSFWTAEPGLQCTGKTGVIYYGLFMTFSSLYIYHTSFYLLSILH